MDRAVASIDEELSRLVGEGITSKGWTTHASTHRVDAAGARNQRQHRDIPSTGGVFGPRRIGLRPPRARPAGRVTLDARRRRGTSIGTSHGRDRGPYQHMKLQDGRIAGLQKVRTGGATPARLQLPHHPLTKFALSIRAASASSGRRAGVKRMDERPSGRHHGSC